MLKSKLKEVLIAPVVVGALGYFVDIYDLVLFSIVRVQSLKALGIEGDELLHQGVRLINMQMGGMLVGGLFWGILGDKKGRISVLFGSIFLYSAANIANAFVTTVDQYAWLRFIAGVGLAGELGAAITLVSETLSKENRGYGTTLIASVGICGAILAGVIGEYLDWKIAYIIGGVLGLALLLLRIKMSESHMFSGLSDKQEIKRGDIKMLFTKRERLIKFCLCILIGVPVWFVIGILVTFSPELSRQLNVSGTITGGWAILCTYAGLAIGDLSSGLLSQWVGSRRRIVGLYLMITGFLIAVYGQLDGVTPFTFYSICFLLGVGTGYWALFVTIAAEQFGTNLRSTIATSAPNFVRGSVVPLTESFRAIASLSLFSGGLIRSAMIVGFASVVIALLALWKMPETYGKDLDYFEID